ncbi:MAG TPA: acyltransferase [Dehalococcoidia bacterium]|nr:acyltransferase [Dehalococcoidia bacterium]
MPGQTKRMEALDGLRGLSALTIFLYHTQLMPVLPGAFQGVAVFFVLSGFLITTLLLQEQDRDGQINLLRFYWRRAVRLLPAAVFLFAVLFGVFWLLKFPPTVYGQVFLNGMDTNGLTVMAARHFSSTLNFLVSDGSMPVTPLTHLWSLSIEQQFYFVWPIVLIGLLALRRTWIMVSLLVVATLVSVLITLAYPASAPNYVAFSTHTQVFQLFFGCLAAVLVHHAPRVRLPQWAVLLAFGALVLHAFYLVPNLEADRTLVGVSATVLVLGCAQGSGIVPRLLSTPPLQYLGSRSYAFYLWHLSFVLWFNTLPVTNQIIAAFIATLLMAEVSYRLVEMPAMAWAKRLTFSAATPVFGLEVRPERLPDGLPSAS